MQKVKVTRRQARAERRAWKLLNGIIDDRPAVQRTQPERAKFIGWDECQSYEEYIDKGGSKKKGGKTKWPNTKTIK